VLPGNGIDVLHQFVAAFHLGFSAGRIDENVMVEAMPAYSDEFWSQRRCRR